MKPKKKRGEAFGRSIETWDAKACFKFLDLSETVQKKLPGFSTAGQAKAAVLERLKALFKDLAKEGDSSPIRYL